MDLAHLESWIGKSETRTERIAAFPSNALAATLDRDDPDYAEGTALPPLWHWMHFLPVYKLSEAGYDGHATLGGFLPPVPLPRRMWAGGRLSFHAPMRIGRELRKTSTIRGVTAKSGRSGDLVFVTVRHQIYDGEMRGITEEHDIVYRGAAGLEAKAPKPALAPTDFDFTREIVPDPVLLFRYSALTFNGHRIHYDQPFCTGTEGYDGLVVHGPLIATLLLDLLRCERPDANIKAFAFRAVAPVFDMERFTVFGKAEGNDCYALWAAKRDGTLIMSAEAIVE